MYCSGSYDFKDKVCSLCYVVNLEAYQKCRKDSVERKKSNDTKTVLDFFSKHCKYAKEIYVDYEDCICCTIEDDCEGYYPNCTPFEYDCIFKKEQKEAINE
jgi:hypothetical protein